MLEALMHDRSCFVTLTYKYLCYRGLDGESGSLWRRHYQLFLKRLRKELHPRLRYYFVGEYGDQTQRPHYHAALFGAGPEDEGAIQRAWPYGFVHVGDLTKDSAQYIAGYTLKKMTKKTDPRLGARYPEFGQPSLKPGIGALNLDGLINTLTSDNGADYLIENGDVPTQLQHGAKKWPLGRYLRRKLRETLGFPEKGAPPEKIEEYKKTMRALLETHLGDEKISKNPDLRQIQVRRALELANSQKILNLETRQKIFTKKGHL